MNKTEEQMLRALLEEYNSLTDEAKEAFKQALLADGKES